MGHTSTSRDINDTVPGRVCHVSGYGCQPRLSDADGGEA